MEVLPKLTVAIDHLVKLGAEPTANNSSQASSNSGNGGRPDTPVCRNTRRRTPACEISKFWL